MVKQLLEKLKGLHYGQEYLCIPYEHFARPLHVYVTIDQKIVAEVTHEHLFVGYAPLIIVLPRFSKDNSTSRVSLAFFQDAVSTGRPVSSLHPLASLDLQPLSAPTPHTYQFFEGLRGRHHFLPMLNRWIIRTANQLYKQQPGNIFLQGNLYEQVQVAYSVPRIISLITVHQGDSCNVFPTDLHGEIAGEYIISLRTGGKALEQVIASQQIVVSEINALAYKKVYAQGKNHMRATQPRETFDFEHEPSRVLQSGLPKGTVAYRELKLKTHFTQGIHTIMIFRILHQQMMRIGISRLSHIHNVYATWRFKKGWKDTYLLR